jgi:hypothetical protein
MDASESAAEEFAAMIVPQRAKTTKKTNGAVIANSTAAVPRRLDRLGAPLIVKCRLLMSSIQNVSVCGGVLKLS